MTASACTPAQRATAGIGIGATGIGVTYGALASMVPSCRVHRPVDQSCVQYSDPLPPKVAFPLVFGGLSLVVLGGLVLATAGEQGEQPSNESGTVPAPPDRPTVLDESDAVGMAIAQLVLVGFDNDAKPSELLGVDDAQVIVRTRGPRAELSNLRIRTAADEAWRAVAACYEYEQEWKLTSVGTAAKCPR